MKFVIFGLVTKLLHTEEHCFSVALNCKKQIMKFKFCSVHLESSCCFKHAQITSTYSGGTFEIGLASACSLLWDSYGIAQLQKNWGFFTFSTCVTITIVVLLNNLEVLERFYETRQKRLTTAQFYRENYWKQDEKNSKSRRGTRWDGRSYFAVGNWSGLGSLFFWGLIFPSLLLVPTTWGILHFILNSISLEPHYCKDLSFTKK